MGDEKLKMSRVWAMPNADTFKVKPIANFVFKYTSGKKCIVDPFARNCNIAHLTNDLNPDTQAKYHMDACDFVDLLKSQNIESDLVLFDPPYSPRQISEVYQSIGIKTIFKDTQTGFLYRKVKEGLSPLLKSNGIALSFGWNSNGFGKKNGFIIKEILIVAHGGAHNDTICMAEEKISKELDVNIFENEEHIDEES